MWRDLPAPGPKAKTADASELVKPGVTAMRDFVVKLRKKLEPRFTGPTVAGLRANSQPLVMWRNRQYASHRMTCDRDALQIEGKPLLARANTPKKPADEDAENDEEEAPTGREERKAGADPDLAVPAAQQDRYQAAFERFCAVFPDTFYVAERGRNYLDKTRDRGRLLSAGFHNLMGYFRDDQPLSQLVLDPAEQKELDRLWRELDFVADATRRTYLQFYLSERRRRGRADRRGRDEVECAPAARPAGDRASRRSRRCSSCSWPGWRRRRARRATRPSSDHFGWVNTTLRWTETARAAAEPRHLQALLDLAGRAYRRPLTGAERDDLHGLLPETARPSGQPGDTASATRRRCATCWSAS